MSLEYPMNEVFFRISLKDSGGDEIMVGKEEIQTILQDAYPGIIVTVTEIDACQVCGGMQQGVPGNENIEVDGRIMCDYCSVKERRRY